MKILITSPSLDTTINVSGISTIVNSLISHNSECEYVHYLLGKPDRISSKFNWFVSFVKQLLYFPFFVKKNRVDLVHQNLPLNTKGIYREFIINCWCRLIGKPILLHVHGGAFLSKKPKTILCRRIIKSLFRRSDIVIVLSDVEKEYIAKLYNYKSAISLCNSVDTEQFISENKFIVGKVPTLLFMGRIHESKGVEDIVEAFRLLKGSINLKFVLCGDGPLKGYLVQACEELLGDNFIFRGVLSGQEKIDVIKEADVFLLPSRYGEGMPMALLETMAAGVVPVVTDDASMKYLIKHQTTGIIVEKNNPQDLSLKITHLLTHPDLYESISHEATKLIISDYNIDTYINSLNKLYRSILK
ncbi:MAG: glycosyltransferase family 4 protein [Dysgonomonas sp.]